MIRVLFDNTEIDGNYIMSLSQTVQPFNSSFTIGNTVCRQFNIDIRNEAITTFPDYVYLYEDNGSQTQSEWTKYATLLIDNIDNQNDHYTRFNLTDIMVRFNQQLVFTDGDTLLEILDAVCQSKNIQLITQSFYMDDFALTWQDEILERDLISYIAEVNGGYAYIDMNGNLNIVPYTNTVSGSVNASQVSDFKIGEKHLIDRVYVELAAATSYYPAASQNDTLYLNSSNILYNTGGDYPLSNVLQHIYSVVNGLEFYNLKIDACIVLPDVRACQMINFINGNENIPFLCTIDFNYNTSWLGGYVNELDTKMQEETQIVSSKEMISRINIKIDRETGEILQQVSQTADNLYTQTSIIQQNADSLEARVSQAENNIEGNSGRLTEFETAVSITASGVTVSQGTVGSYTKFTDSGMDIYVESAKVAWARSDGFGSEELTIGGSDDLEKWHIHMSNNGNTLTFLKKE